MEIDIQTSEYCCEDVQELLTLLVACSEELTIDERDEVSKHLGRCGSCRKDWECSCQCLDHDVCVDLRGGL